VFYYIKCIVYFNIDQKKVLHNKCYFYLPENVMLIQYQVYNILNICILLFIHKYFKFERRLYMQTNIFKTTYNSNVLPCKI